MASSVRQFSKPYMITGTLSEGQATGLDQIVLAANQRVEGVPRYDEDWIQNLIHQYPDLLPVKELEPAFYPLYPVCRELRTAAGPLDNLFVSENGGLVLVECKLWRNPEARREVIGQALDYAKEISRWSYEDLVGAVKQTTKSLEDEVLKAVRDGRRDKTDDLDEKTFIDAVSRNLKRGRFLLLIVGDGIREGVEEITNFLQRHAGLDFTFGLVELSVFKVRGREEFLIQPRILANSVTIERGVIRIDQQGAISLEPPDKSVAVTEAQKAGKRGTISEQEFYEKLTEGAGATVANDLRRYVEKLATIDVTPVFGSSSLNLRWFPASNRKMNFGSIRSNGTVDTDPANWVCTGIERPDIGEKYQTDLAALIGAQTLMVKNGAGLTIRVVRDGKPIQVRELLSASDKWFAVIVAMQEVLAKAVRQFDEE
jgi:hypothetical protein